MCGVVAALGKVNVGPAVAALRHRGIRHRIVETPRGSVGHVRLPIVGVGEEHDQPMKSDDGRWVVAFVGQVLDFKDCWEGDCDAEFVVERWERRASSALAGHDGFWSVLALDQATGCLHVLVDYLAQKPVYYRSDLVVAAASEPDAVAMLAPVTPDELYFSSVVKWGYCPDTRRTPYEEVKKTLPGEHVVMWPSGHVSRDVVDRLVPKKTFVMSELKHEIEVAVKRRVLSSDVPVATLVSGGLDSAIVYTLAKRYGDPHVYHVENDELYAMMSVVSGYATASSYENGANATPQIVATPTVLECKDVGLKKALAYMQEPLDLGSLCPQVALSDAVGGRGGERVCLTGDGADEFFGGYARALRYDSQASDVWHELVAWHLPRLDRVMMRNRIEVRSPFLARRVAEMALALPHGGRMNKSVLRSLFAADLPPGTVDRPKKALKTREVEDDREKRSRELVEIFRRGKWPNK